MVVLTVIADSNDLTVHFREPPGNLLYIRLLSCTFFNSWCNLKKDEEILISDDQGNTRVGKFVPVITHTQPSEEKSKEHLKDRLDVQFDNAKGAIMIENPFYRNVCFDRDFSFLLGLPKQCLKPPNVTNRLSSFKIYVINCGLLDKIKKQW